MSDIYDKAIKSADETARRNEFDRMVDGCLSSHKAYTAADLATARLEGFKEGLEAAAKVCDGPDANYGAGYAAKIRALISPETNAP